MQHLLVDGYNLLHAVEKGDRRYFGRSLQEKRDFLLEDLHRYTKAKNIPVTVVFDGASDAPIGQPRERFGDILVVFSDPKQTADDSIILLAERSEHSYIVITSDHEIVNAVENPGFVSMTSEAFVKKLVSAKQEFVAEENPFFEDKLDDQDPLYPRVSTRKKGSSRKLPKKQRRRNHILRHL